MLTTTYNEQLSRWEGIYTIGIDAPVNSAKEDMALTGGEFTLAQNFPNPVTDKTTIRFTLLRNSNVQLGIYDMNGKQVALLIDASLLAGEHSHEWLLIKHNKLATGNYLFQLSVENSTGLYRQAKVMTIL